MRVLVCGSRKWTDRALLELTLAALAADATIVHGDHWSGADRMARQYCEARGIADERYPADWRQGKAAGPIRNQRMVDTKPDLCIAFGTGRGTEDCVRRALKAGIPVRRIA